MKREASYENALGFKHISISVWICKSVRIWIPTFPSGFLLWELDFMNVLKLWDWVLENIPCPNWVFFEIFGKVLKSKCWKWFPISIWRLETQVMAKKLGQIKLTIWFLTMKTQKKAQMIFDLECATYLCKGLFKCSDFAYDFFSIGVFI